MTTTDYNDQADRALAEREPVRALELLDQPWMLGLPMTEREAQRNSDLEDRARSLDQVLHGEHE